MNDQKKPVLDRNKINMEELILKFSIKQLFYLG